MKRTTKLRAIHRMAGIITLLVVIGLSMAACDDGAGGGNGGGTGNDVPAVLLGQWAYNGNELFAIEPNNTGSVGGQGSYSVQAVYSEQAGT